MDFYVDGDIEKISASVLRITIYFEPDEKAYCEIDYNLATGRLALVSVPWNFSSFMKKNFEIFGFAADQFKRFLEHEQQKLPIF